MLPANVVWTALYNKDRHCWQSAAHLVCVAKYLAKTEPELLFLVRCRERFDLGDEQLFTRAPGNIIVWLVCRG